MRFKDVFSIIGPPMVGPSSSHTAGAVRIGRAARQLLGEMPTHADIQFFGSFAETYQGHGTDLAIVAGLLDYDTDDLRIPRSIANAEEAGMTIVFGRGKGIFSHPNTARLTISANDKTVILTGVSIGGGNIEVVSVNEFIVKFTCIYPTLILSHEDRPGMIAEVTRIMMREGINIGSMCNDRKGRSGEAMTVLELDSAITRELMAELEAISTVREVAKIDFSERNGKGQ
ncbi:L-serine ammonia-lyase, iron-sulfur-dependent subunit beta [Paenibacillus contaminans]|uniref:L-serine deaminase n=1 Tax=Paenibacillus contaminans TaxID=450362 RepID=A0A329MRZ4_9BACL|nr:L-serine ammonia-lyase, iron-sulfur-dependent subunit beta [Paenibacillus contaminans]RAV22058.1 L-serine ammonia-lyase, iron-sulfur-dependent, subunit beta [Paenibacillus contaminans]